MFRLCGQKGPMMPGARASHWQVHEKSMKDGFGFFFFIYHLSVEIALQMVHHRRQAATHARSLHSPES